MTMPRKKEDEWYAAAVREIDEHRKDPERWKKYVTSRATVALDNWRRSVRKIRKVCEILAELKRIQLRKITSAWRRSPETFWDEVTRSTTSTRH